MHEAVHFVPLKSGIDDAEGNDTAMLDDAADCADAGRDRVLAALVLVGCALAPHRAPVEDRSDAPRPVAAASAGAARWRHAAGRDGRAAPLPGAENAGKPGYYTVKPGDTLIRIALENGQNWRDIARWNDIDNPNVIEVGQVLRVVPPGADAGDRSARAVAPAAVETRPLTARRGRVAARAGPAAAAPAPPTPPARARRRPRRRAAAPAPRRRRRRHRATATTTSPGPGRRRRRR